METGFTQAGDNNEQVSDNMPHLFAPISWRQDHLRAHSQYHKQKVLEQASGLALRADMVYR